MQSQHHGLMSRSSSTTLSFVDRPYVPEGGVDDLVITQGLLDGTKTLAKRLSYHEVPGGMFSHDGSVGQDESSDSQNAAVVGGRSRRGFGTSNTWTSSSGEMPTERDAIEDRSQFVQEYNRLAKKHCVRSMVVEDFPNDALDPYGKPGSWFSRKILRRTSSTQSIPRPKTDRPLRHKRSISDLSLRLKSKNDRLKDKDLQELVRLCGSSLLYLPTEYAPGSLAVPTCFRATAQYLVQHAPTARGIFRISGSHGTVALLYNHYCAMDEGGYVISGTVRCPTLPDHISCDVHDVASAFKKFLSGLPGGILGSLRLFDALISIQTQLHSDPELTRTRQSKVRARLIALAILTLKSQYRRELICAVFGLLCMIGRAAETSKREDDRGRPLPTSDLMGYGPLGIVFGPLLVGDLLETYTMRLANPHGGLILLPISPPKSRKERQKEKQKKPNPLDDNTTSFNTFVDKIKVANGVTEMLITHWREVVRHMKILRALKPLSTHKSLAAMSTIRPFLRASASDTFAIRKPPDWDDLNSTSRRLEGSASSPTPAGRATGPTSTQSASSTTKTEGFLTIRKQRSRTRPVSINMLTGTRSMSILSPTTEDHREDFVDAEGFPSSPTKGKRKDKERSSLSSRHSRTSRKDDSTETPSGSSKLRKPRPTTHQKDGQLSISKMRRLTKHSPLINSTKSANNPMPDESKLGDKSLQDSSLSQQCPKKIIQPGILSSPSKLVLPNGGTKASRKAYIPEGLVSRQVRRIAASEPPQDPAYLGSPRRTFSKSMHVDSSGRAKHFKAESHPKDPLSLVSREEDMASLRFLAEAIQDEVILPGSNGFDGSASPDKITSTQPTLPEHELSELPSTSPTVASHQNKTSYSTLSNQVPAVIQDASQQTIGSSPSFSTPPKRIPSNTSPIKRFSSPGLNVKALAARFNTSDTTHVFESPNKMSSLKSSNRDGQPSPLRKDNLVASYTTNTPSPTRSQKSSSSEKTPQLTRKPLGELRPASRLSTSPGKLLAQNVRPNNLTLKPIVGTLHQSLPGPVLSIMNSCSDRLPVAPSITEQSVSRTFDGHGSAGISRADSPHRTSHPSLEVHHSNTSDCPKMGPALHISSSTQLADICSALPLNVMPKSPHVHFAAVNFTENSGTDDTCSGTAYPHLVSNSPALSVSLPGTPVSRSNSVLNTKIRTLQKELAAKTEEVRLLRKQLDARLNLDVGTLSEQLREATIEKMSWKTRAEVSAKQVEMLSKRTLGRSVSVKAQPPRPSEASVTQSEDGPKSLEKNRRTWHGMDGATSNDWNSEATTGTVIRDIKDAPTGSEYSVWVQQTLKELEMQNQVV